MSAGQDRQREIWIFTWRNRFSPMTNTQCLLACAGVYARENRLPDLPPPDLLSAMIARDKKGKPYFAGLPQVCFSVSHSGDYVTCAYALQPLGLDLQIHSSCNRPGIARRFFHPAEAAWLAANDFQDFFMVWAAKESYVKYTGEGIGGSFQQFSVVADDGLVADLAGAKLRALPFAPGYSMCLCAQRPDGIRRITVTAFQRDGGIVWEEEMPGP
jgi:4'-phosphopantetheinyl transferase